jgi:uncharacterized protein
MREIARRIAALIVVVIVIAVVTVGAYYILFPAPDPRFVGIPTIYPYANDNAGALSPGYVELLDEICYYVDAQTSCEIAVLVVNTTQPHDINYFALRTFQKNGIGNKGVDNGVLIVVATDDGTWRVEVGYGLMGILTGARVTNLVDAYFIPYYGDGNLDDGLVELTAAIGNVIIDEYTGDTSGSPAYPISWVPLELWQWLLILGAIGVGGVLTRGRIFIPLIWIIQLMGRSGGKFGGGRSGGGGGQGRL